MRRRVLIRPALQPWVHRSLLPRISPTPALMIVAPIDRFAPGEWACQTIERRPTRRNSCSSPGGHFDAYQGEAFEPASTAARDFLVQHLSTAGSEAAHDPASALA
jgi:hypothetical protein